MPRENPAMEAFLQKEAGSSGLWESTGMVLSWSGVEVAWHAKGVLAVIRPADPLPRVVQSGLGSLLGLCATAQQRVQVVEKKPEVISRWELAARVRAVWEAVRGN